MIEVFKTNVSDPDQAQRLVETIHALFTSVEANFDLEDCDKILRIKATESAIDPQAFTALLSKFGFRAEVLQDEVDIDARSQTPQAVEMAQ